MAEEAAAVFAAGPGGKHPPKPYSASGGKFVRKCKSGREDLNLRPLRPERSALAKLSYAPIGNAE